MSKHLLSIFFWVNMEICLKPFDSGVMFPTKFPNTINLTGLDLYLNLICSGLSYNYVYVADSCVCHSFHYSQVRFLMKKRHHIWRIGSNNEVEETILSGEEITEKVFTYLSVVVQYEEIREILMTLFSAISLNALCIPLLNLFFLTLVNVSAYSSICSFCFSVISIPSYNI